MSTPAFNNSYIATNRQPNAPGSAELFGDQPQAGAGLSYCLASAPYQTDGSQFDYGGGENAFFEALLADLGDGDSVTVFVHGLDTDWNGAAQYTALLGANLNGCSLDGGQICNPPDTTFATTYTGLVIGFSWPSTTSIFDYLTDRSNIRASADSFVAFVTALQSNLPAGTKISIVCHSEGNYMMKVGADAIQAAGLGVVFDQILLVAADLPEDCFATDGFALGIPTVGASVTTYFANDDTVLAEADVVMALLDELGETVNEDLFPDDYSNWYPTWQRLGTFGIPSITKTVSSNINEVNCTLVDIAPTGFSTHTAYFVIPQIIEDFGQTLSGVAPKHVANRVYVPGTDDREFWAWPVTSEELGIRASLERRIGGSLGSKITLEAS